MRRQEWNWAIWLWAVVVCLVSADLSGMRPLQRVFGTGIEIEVVSKDREAEEGIRADAGELGGRVDERFRGQGIEESEDQYAEKEEKCIALTFDDGPHGTYTPVLLDGLKERGVHASFFLIGQNIVGNEEIVLRMQKEGHLIGNHSQSHAQLTGKDKEAACREIGNTNQQIFDITGQTPSCVRPPFGSWSEELECLVPMTVVLWDVDPLDWKVQNKTKIVKHVVEHVEEGDIILLHDVYETSVEAALEIVDRLSAKGYNFVTVDELLID